MTKNARKLGNESGDFNSISSKVVLESCEDLHMTEEDVNDV